MLYKVVLTFQSVDETLVCDHSIETYRAVLSRVYYALHGSSNFLSSVKPGQCDTLPLNAEVTYHLREDLSVLICDVL